MERPRFASLQGAFHPRDDAKHAAPAKNKEKNVPPLQKAKAQGYGKHTMSSFATSGRVFVLGAGASAFAGYPLASGLLRFIRDFQSLEVMTKQIASRVLDKLNQAEFLFNKHIIRDPNRVPNLEELLTYLELYRSFPGTIFAANPWDSSDSAAIRRVITEKFLEYQYDLQKSAWGSGTALASVATRINEIRKVAEAWPKLLKPGDVILTFNWDILHEVILWRSGLWSYRDGYGFQCGAQGEREDCSQVLILKLHGSVNWVQEDDYDPVTEVANVPDFFVNSKDWAPRSHYSQAQTDSGRKLVLPTYLKDISSNRALLDVWTRAHLFIREAKQFFVLGYSLNRVDHPARLLFGTALSENGALKEVTVVSPDATQWATFLTQLTKEMIRVRQKFEEWVFAASGSNPSAPA